MLTGWKQQQLARNFTAGTIRGRAKPGPPVRGSHRAFSWDWTVGDADEFFAHERSILNLAFATIRAYQTHLKVFCDFLTDPVYEWDRVCRQGFGCSPAQIITEFNRVRHAQNNEQAPTKRPFTRAELQGFFDLADLEVERVLVSGRKGAVAAYRDATVFKTAYAWGCGPTRSRTCRPWTFPGTAGHPSSASSVFCRSDMARHSAAHRPRDAPC